jgi:hypothetical protein
MIEPTRSRDRYHDATMGEAEQYRQGADDMRAVILARLTAAGLMSAAALVTAEPRPGPREPITGLHYRGG